MDGQRFDRLARRLASRRGVLGGAVAVVVGGSAASLGEAAAKDNHRTCRRGRQTCQRNGQCCSGTCATGRAVALKDRNRCTCEGESVVCGNACVDTGSDERNCGACGVRCGAGEACCGGDCIGVREDDRNCGACNHVCESNEACEAGHCVCQPACEGRCGGDDGCGGVCPGAGLHYDDSIDECVTAATYCNDRHWVPDNENETRSTCHVTVEGEVKLTCWNPAAGFRYTNTADIGPCVSDADCTERCANEEPGYFDCFCSAAQYYENYAPDDYSGDGNLCHYVYGTQPYTLDLADTCGYYT